MNMSCPVSQESGCLELPSQHFRVTNRIKFYNVIKVHHLKTESNPEANGSTQNRDPPKFLASLGKEHGDVKLAQRCGTIAADEKRHEIAYSKIVEKLFEIDPDETMLALAAVAQRLGVYTAKDYADIVEFLIGRWNVDKVRDISGEGRRAQEFVCELAMRIRRGEKKEMVLLRFPSVEEK
ncbi:hypothetical protein Pint_19542 [Pistacia integerrima]|uniref:Uncharacterized protein n=1 Tax=Pistacia integerrima TaxID=434235 RepID=A0ACC0XAM0_9ROSI|nr:hypothetical protein Pint_19542 [Pistacia integerrima]